MKNEINTDKAPKAIGPYSQAIKTGELLFISGQIPIDPTTNSLVEGSFKDKVKQVFKNLENICIAGGTKLNNAVKLNIFLTDLSKFSQVNEVMESIFTKPYPARATIEISALPLDVEVEIDAVVVSE